MIIGASRLRRGGHRLPVFGGSGGGASTGAAATTSTAMGMTPTVQYHPNTSPITMRPDGTFQGYISGTTLVVTSWANGTAQTIREGVEIISGAAAGTKVAQSKGGLGGTGQYYINISQTVGSSGSPVTFTMKSTEIASITDLKGNADLSIADPAGAIPGKGPQLLTDGNGVKFLRFSGGASIDSWLRSLTLSGLDSGNMTWLIVGMVRNQNYVGGTTSGAGAGTIIQTGTQEAGTGSSNAGANISIYAGMPTFGGLNIGSSFPGLTNLNKMLLGEQLQVFGTAQATTDGLNGSSTFPSAANATSLAILNEQTASVPRPTGNNRVINQTGFTFGRSALAANSYAYIDVYEMVGFLTGQLGTTMAAIPAKIAQATSALMSNYGINPITQSFLAGGDSRTVYGEGGGAGPSADGSGYSIASVLAERGRSYSLPSNVRILNYGQPGEGVAKARAVIDFTADYFANGGTAGSTPLMLGGGNDYYAFFMGVNDAGGTEWPTTSGGGGALAPNSAALGDDLYNGAGYQVTANVTNSAGSLSGTFSVTSGTMFAGYRVTSAGFSGGQSAASISGTTVNFNRYEPTAHSTTATTLRIDGYLAFVQTLLSRGFKVLAAIEPYNYSQAGTLTAAQASLAGHLRTNLIADAGAGTGGPYQGKLSVCDLPLIQSGGVFPFGADYQGTAIPGVNFADLQHLTKAGKVNAVSGADTPQYGYATAIKALLAL